MACFNKFFKRVVGSYDLSTVLPKDDGNVYISVSKKITLKFLIKLNQT